MLNKHTVYLLGPLMLLLASCNGDNFAEGTKFQIMLSDDQAVDVKLSSYGNLIHGPTISISSSGSSRITDVSSFPKVFADVKDADNDIAQVRFLLAGREVKKVLTAPFELELAQLSLVNGTYSVSAIVTDQSGLEKMSNTLMFEVIIANDAGSFLARSQLPFRIGQRHYVAGILMEVFGAQPVRMNFPNARGTARTSDVWRTVYGLPGTSLTYDGQLGSGRGIWDFWGGTVSDGFSNPYGAEHLIANFVHRRVEAFGGVCEANRTHLMYNETNGSNLENAQNGAKRYTRGGLWWLKDGNGVPEFLEEGCYEENFANLGTANREGFLIRFCTEVTKNQKALLAAVSNSSGNLMITPSPAQQKNLFQLFYPYLDYDSEMEQAVGEVVRTQSNPADAWRVLIEAVCQSSYWQVL